MKLLLLNCITLKSLIFYCNELAKISVGSNLNVPYPCWTKIFEAVQEIKIPSKTTLSVIMLDHNQVNKNSEEDN